MTKFGPWVERLEAVAVGRELVAVAGRRDAAGAARVHVVPVAVVEGTGKAWSLAAGAVGALAFAGDDLLLTGGDDGRVVAWDVTGQKALAEVNVGAPVRALAVDPNVARGDAGAIAAGTADGALHVIAFAVKKAKPALGAPARQALSDGAIHAIAWDPAGLWLAGGADGQLWICRAAQPPGSAADRGDATRAVLPGGDGGIRAIVSLGDGRAAVGCGDGSLRLCFIVGAVEAVDRSGDHGHEGALRGLAAGPQAVDERGRDLPRRLFSVGEDGALKLWFAEGNRRPRTIELGIGPATALAFAPGPVVKPAVIERAVGRLWIAGSQRKLAALALGPEVEPVGEPIAIGSELDRLEAVLRDKSAVKVKLEAIDALAQLGEDEARLQLDNALASGAPEVKLATTRAMVRSERRASRPALRAVLAKDPPELRAAAFHALLELEREQPLAAIRAGLGSSAQDVRVLAVAALVALARGSVIAAGLIADALRDNHPNVRRRAYAALREVTPQPLEAVRTALARGLSDVRAEALLDLGFAIRDASPAARALTAGAFDDDDAGVRIAAFLAALVQRPALAARLTAEGAAGAPSLLAAIDPGLAERFTQIAQHTKLSLPRGGALDDDELEPLFAQLACRSGDAALRGAGGLLVLGDRRAAGAILQLTREADPMLRRAATAQLVRALAAWPDDDRLAPRLSWLLDDGDAEVRAFAFDALAREAATGGPQAELELAELALRTSQEDIRVRALQILVRVGAPGSAVAARGDALLGDALDDEAAKVRHEAFRTLQTWHSSEPMVSLARGARSRHGDLRTLVVQELDRRRQAAPAAALAAAIDKLLTTLVGDPVPAVGLAAYGALTREPDEGTAKVAPEVHLAAMASPAAAVRAAGAKGAARAPASAVRARLIELIKDDHPEVHQAAIESLDTVAPTDAEGFALGFASIFYDLQVRAGELTGRRRDARAIAPMQRLLSIPKTDLNRPSPGLRQRAARALADVGEPATIAFQLGLIEDDDPLVREMAARGIATAARPDEASRNALLSLLGHADLPVRSWGGEGLAKLGDLRALPVLAGTQRHDHRPLRVGAIVGFVALGPEGVRGLRQGLEDADREISDLAFAVIVARDAALAAAGIAPDLLVDAMASPSAEIRFAAARLYERRQTGEALDADAIGELVGPRKPEKAAEMKDWPAPARRAALLQVVADAIASNEPARRYAATQVLAARPQPLTFWREAARLAGPSAQAPAPYTNFSTESRTQARAGWLRRLVGDRRDPEATGLEVAARLFLRAGQRSSADAAAAERLVFGVYAGLVRQAPARGASDGAAGGRGPIDETHRVRRDAIGRLVELARQDAVGPEAVLPVLGHAVSDPHHLVRQAAMAALRALYPVGALAPLQMAIAGAADLGKAAIDELVGLAAGGDDRARALIRGALDADVPEVRAHAARRLARLYPAGSVEPQLLAAQSRHADVRLAAVTELASAMEDGAGSAAITDALVAALASEHADLRLRAASALARRGNPLGIEVLAAFLRDEDHADDALEALEALADGKGDGAGAAAAAEAVASRLDEIDRGLATSSDEWQLLNALESMAQPIAAPVLVRRLVAIKQRAEDEDELDVDATFDALMAILAQPNSKPRELSDDRTRRRLRDELALTHLGDLTRSPLQAVRLKAARALGEVDARGAEDILARVLGDRDAEVRVAAAESLALRAEVVPDATLSALEAALRGGRRELVLPAAFGLAVRKRPEAFQPLLLVAKAGEPAEQERAVLALGALGDRRALEQLLPLLDPAPDDQVALALRPAAAEALGRLVPVLGVDEAADVRARIERMAMTGAVPLRKRALSGLRYAGEIGLVEAMAADREAMRDLRTHAIALLGEAAAPTSEAVLVELLSDSDYSVREAAMTALGKLLKGDRTRVGVHALGSTFDNISGPAARYLAMAGDPAALAARLGTIRSASVREMLREGLIRRAALPVAELDAALRSPDATARTEAAWIAGYAGVAAQPIAAAIEGAAGRGVPAATAGKLGPAQLAEIEASWASLWAARRVGRAPAVGAVAEKLLADERAVATLRREAAAVLAVAGTASAHAALGKAVEDSDREVRAVAANALAAVLPASAVPTVRAVGSRADATTIAPLALAAWPQLAGELIGEPGTRTWAVAVSLIGRRVDELIAIARGKGAAAARIAAIGALGRLGGDAARDAVQAIHDDKREDDAIKLAAWKAFKRISRKGVKVYAEGQDKGPSDAGGGLGGDEEELDESDLLDEDDEDDFGDDDDDDGDDEDSDGEDSDDDSDDEDDEDEDEGSDDSDDDSDDEDDEDEDEDEEDDDD